MRAIEFLLELRNPIEAGYYGAWINADERELHYVPNEGHMRWVIENIPGSDKVDRGNYGAPLYMHAFQNGFVRLIHPGEYSLAVTGRRSDIKKIVPIIRAAALHRAMIVLAVLDDDKVAEGVWSATESKYDIPKERNDLMKYLRDEV